MSLHKVSESDTATTFDARSKGLF